jgi:hypothetical protein
MMIGYEVEFLWLCSLSSRYLLDHQHPGERIGLCRCVLVDREYLDKTLGRIANPTYATSG